MSVFLAVVLGVVQALTEFLPVSSSGHLVVFQSFLEPYFGGGKTPLLFDVVVHVATLMATLVFLSGDIRKIISGMFLKTAAGQEARKTVLFVAIGTIPAVIVGLGFHEQLGVLFGSVKAAASGFVVTTIVLIATSFVRGREGEEENTEQAGLLGWKLPSMTQALLIGCAQAVAIYPGVSRSGSTIAIALLLGCSSNAAVRFSFLLSIPAILGALVLEGAKVNSFSDISWLAYGAGFLAAFLVGLLAIRLLVIATREAKLSYFAAYTGLLALSLFLFAG